MNLNKLSAYFVGAACAFSLLVMSASAQQTPVNLGTASTYGVLAGSAVTNTGATVVSGDLGLSPGTSVTGFPPGTVLGTKQITNAAAAQAQTDLTAAYIDAAGRAATTVPAELGGQTLVPGAYKSGSSFQITGILTLDAQNDPNAVFIFQSPDSTLTTASGSQVKLINGASYCNVFWQIGSSATLGTTSDFEGTIMALQSITATTGASVHGRLLARNGAVTLDTNAVTTVCSVTPTGSITVVKNTVGGNGTFTFTSNFGLTSLTTVGGTASKTFNSLTPRVGTYNVSETVPTGWTQTSATCTNGTPAAITVVAGATTTCTFTNTEVVPTGSITVVKNTVGGNGTFAFTSNFGLTSLTTSGGTASKTFNSLTPGVGTYNVSETVPTGWTQTGATCTNGTPAAITVVAGATTTCTFTNTEVVPTGSITVVKNTVGGDGIFTFTSNFGLTSLTTSGGTASKTFNSLTPGVGTYNVSETVPAGWTQTGATCTNGTPAAITVVAGTTTTCTFTNTEVVPTGSITVLKFAVGGNGTFTFTSNFGLASLTTIAGTARQTFSGLTPGGSYHVSETVPAGWTQTSATCTNGTPAAITVVAGATTTCTFNNTQAAPTGSIKVVKNTVGGDGTFAFTSNFGLTSLTTSGGTASQTFSGLTPGSSFSASEIVPSGWTQTSATCTNGTPAAITVVAGATTTCTFANTQQGASIKVVKITVGGDGTFAFTSNFGLASLTTSGGTASQTFSGLTPGGSYHVSETVPAGWTQTSATCTNGTPAAITVVAGATTTCTFSNTQQGASIKVVKNTVGGNGTFAFTSNFGLTSLTTVGLTASQTFSGLTPGGSYHVSETVPTGWTQTSATCTNGTPAAITVVAGATTTCTFLNTQATQTGSIRVVKNAVGGDGTFTFTGTLGLTSLTTIGGTASRTFGSLTPGSSFSVSETVHTGWTLTSASCTNGTPAAITVVAGATTTCTFLNTQATQTGSIRVVKNTVGGNGTFTFTSNFGLASLTTSGTTSGGTASQTFGGLTPGGSYSVRETVPTGWTQTSASCDNGTPAAITVAAGATTTCTFTNTQATTAGPDVTISKSHTGNFRQGDAADTYTLTVTNVGKGPTTGVVTVTDMLPAGLTATAISGVGWSCTLTPLSCTRNDVLATGTSYPVITVTVSVANNAKDFASPAGSPTFQAGDILISMEDGTVQWRRSDWTLVKVLTPDSGQAKGLAFNSSGDLFVTHWYGTVSSGNDVVEFDPNGNRIGLFGGGYDCNPSSIVFDNSGNAYVGQADCGTQILKFDSAGKLLAQYSVAIENRGTYHIVLDADQCTMYYTSEGPDVKRFNVCNNTQMSNFNNAPLPDLTEGAQQFTQLPGGGMLVADFSVIADLDASGNFVRAYGASSGSCWLGIALDSDGTSFSASDWCTSSVTRFDIATGKVIESHVISDTGFMVKQIAIPPNIFSTTATNTATVAGGGEVNLSNDSASDVTAIDPPRQVTGPTGTATGIFNAAGYAPVVAAGSIASVFGSNLSSGQATAHTIPLPTTLASSSFLIGGLSAPLFFASPGQVNLQIPWELAGQSQASVTGTVGSVISMQQVVNMAPFAPGLFTLETGSSQGAVMITGTQLLAASPSGDARRPVAAGESITIYCTGLGAVSNQPATGFAAQANPLSVTTTTPTVTIGGIMAQVSLSALVPGAVGLYQVNVLVPAGVPAGDAVPVILRIGGVSSNAVTIAVQ